MQKTRETSVARIPQNTRGRDLIVGDIHGHFTRLQAALNAAGFDPYRDRLFSVGDLVDRGPESYAATVWLEQPWFFAVAGNHEDMAIRWPAGHMDADTYTSNGGGWNVANTRDERVRFSDAFSCLPIAIELETERGIVGIVHAECPFASWQDFTTALEDTSMSTNKRGSVTDVAQWSRRRITERDQSYVQGVRAVVVGHTPLVVPAILGNTHYIDTMGWRPAGHFTLLDAKTLLPVNLT